MRVSFVLSTIAGSEAGEDDPFPRLLAYTMPSSFWPRWIRLCIAPPFLQDDTCLTKWRFNQFLIEQYRTCQVPMAVRMRTYRRQRWRWDTIAIGVPTAYGLNEDTSITLTLTEHRFLHTAAVRSA